MSIEGTATNDIANRAQALWEQAGRPPGRDLEFWLAAEEHVRAIPKAPPITADASSAAGLAANPSTRSVEKPVQRNATRKERPRKTADRAFGFRH